MSDLYTTYRNSNKSPGDFLSSARAAWYRTHHYGQSGRTEPILRIYPDLLSIRQYTEQPEIFCTHYAASSSPTGLLRIGRRTAADERRHRRLEENVDLPREYDPGWEISGYIEISGDLFMVYLCTREPSSRSLSIREEGGYFPAISPDIKTGTPRPMTLGLDHLAIETRVILR